jgi:hypothetical protein
MARSPGVLPPGLSVEVFTRATAAMMMTAGVPGPRRFCADWGGITAMSAILRCHRQATAGHLRSMRWLPVFQLEYVGSMVSWVSMTK